jgi:CheY-like chemotaxis protein
MSDELFCLKVVIACDVAADRELLRRAASQCSAPIEIAEIRRAGDGAPASEALQDGDFDVLLLDSRLPQPTPRVVLAGARTAKGKPLVIVIGPSEWKAPGAQSDSLSVDGVLGVPIRTDEAHRLLECCIRARLSCRALIVDDSPTVRSVIRKVLQASRYRIEVEEAADGSEAIKQTADQRFDLIFLDCHMPGVDGFGALDVIKHAMPDTKVVMITGQRDARIEERARQSGAADFLFKPFFAKDIDAVLNRLFGLMQPRWD